MKSSADISLKYALIRWIFFRGDPFSDFIFLAYNKGNRKSQNYLTYKHDKEATKCA